LIRVLLVAPSPAMRAGLRALLAIDQEIEVVDERNGRSDVVDENIEADVMIMTSASIASFLERKPGSQTLMTVLFLSDEPLNERQVRRAAHLLWGILPMDSSGEELISAIHALAEGLIVGARSLLFPPEEETSARGPLTEREVEVLALLAKGLANKQIATGLAISEHTVKFHVSSIFTKLNVTNRTAAVQEGLRGGWIAL
jgi:DNA-binding NarL/FixJ family response regulator